jgi:serine/threonine protein kinase
MSQKSPKFSESELLHAAIQIASGMEDIHDRNMVHGNLQPVNVLGKPADADGFCLRISEENLFNHINGVYKIAHFDTAFYLDDDDSEKRKACLGKLP